MKETPQDIRESILDRLTRREPPEGAPVPWRRTTLAELEVSVRRDLEKLLNTKNYAGLLASGYHELPRSLFAYGIPDFTSCNPKSPSVRSELREQIEQAITLFEPRLRNVTVRVEQSEREERNLRFKVSALLVLESVTAPVTFDTYFDANKGEYRIPG